MCGSSYHSFDALESVMVVVQKIAEKACMSSDAMEIPRMLQVTQDYCDNPGIILGWVDICYSLCQSIQGFYPSWDNPRMGWTYATPYVRVFGNS